MTRIYFIVNLDMMLMHISDDPRSPRELVKLINTGEFVVGADEVFMEGQPQWAMAHPPLHVITVMLVEPPVELSPRLYDVLYGIADGKRAEEIAQDLGISTRTVYEYTALLKARFEVDSKEEIIDKALKMKILCVYLDDMPEA